ncbi:MAG: DUF763 domain-containing protein [Candidatus Pacearchaeota archaeon]
MLKGVVDLPLHYGSSPRWLFERMKKLAQAISEIIVNEYGTKVLLERLSEPYWFQSFACVLGFDWHSSGTTTVTLGALKEVFKTSELSQELAICGGKGKQSRKTPQEIKTFGERLNLSDRKIKELVRASKLVAKVDNAALQDGFQLYHHSFIFTSKGDWATIQQGMNQELARRYHWISHPGLNFVCEPHAAVASDIIVKPLNMVAREAEEARKISLDLIKENPSFLRKELKNLNKKRHEKTLTDFAYVSFSMPGEHFPKIKNFNLNFKAVEKAYQRQPENYEELLLIDGIGPSTVRALALVSNLIYGSELSWRDPCKYAFAHGGKDGWPYPIDKGRYDKTVSILQVAIRNAKLGRKEQYAALERLSKFCNHLEINITKSLKTQ